MLSNRLLINSLPMCIKRGPYINYKKYPETVAKVIQILKDDAPGDVDIIVEKTGFKRRTLYNWRKTLKYNPSFNPLGVKVRPNSRIFTEEEEDSIALFIWSEKILKGSCFTDEDGIEILTNAFLDKHYNDENFDFEYNVSNGYIYEFKKRHSFVSKLCHLKRRPSTNNTNYNFIDSFIEEMKKLFDTCANARIVNVDETAIFVSPKQLRIWHSKGVDDVSIPVQFNEKQRITAVCAIAADGFKFPIQFIAKGQTEQVLETQIGDVGHHLRAYSENGWTNTNTFYQFLNHIRSHFEGEGEIHVILDLYKAHNNEEIKEAAEQLGIKLHFIPAGFTDKFQPLDAKIFAIIKAYIRHFVRQCLREGKVLSKLDAVNWMVRSWEKLETSVVQESFDYLILGEKWDGYGQDDCACIHTCKYSRAMPRERKIMILEEIKQNGFKDDDGKPFMDYIIESFDHNDSRSVTQIKEYIEMHALIKENELLDSQINDSIRRLHAFKILQKDYDIANPTFKLTI